MVLYQLMVFLFIKVWSTSSISYQIWRKPDQKIVSWLQNVVLLLNYRVWDIRCSVLTTETVNKKNVGTQERFKGQNLSCSFAVEDQVLHMFCDSFDHPDCAR